MRKVKFGFALFLLLSSVCFAGDKSKTFESSVDEVFQSAIRVAAKNWSVTFSDEKAHIFSFNTGMSFTSNGMECSVRVKQKKDGSEIVIHTQKKLQMFAWGVGDRIAKKLFEGIESDLKTSKTSPEAMQPSK